ncbi:MAG TPA: hypothetical protein VGD65_20075 [Chryseosolibacter sp.]
MNDKNVEYLKDGVKYLGFGEELGNKLVEELKLQKNEFQLHSETQYGKDKMSYTLNFRKSDQSEMVFFNNYTATLSKENGEEKSQTFYIKKNSGVTAKEAYNLLSGRAVNKDLTNQEGEKYNAWLQMDWNQKDNGGNYKFKTMSEGYGYKLEEALSKHPIKELNDPTSRERLLKSLERGNLHQVTFLNGEKETKMYIEANPQFKTVNLYDENGKKVFQQNEKKQPAIENEAKPSPIPEAKKKSPSADKHHNANHLSM